MTYGLRFRNPHLSIIPASGPSSLPMIRFCVPSIRITLIYGRLFANQLESLRYNVFPEVKKNCLQYNYDIVVIIVFI